MDIREHAGISMQVHGYPQTSMDIHGHPQMSLDIHGDLWKSMMDIIGYPLIFTDIPRYPWIAMEIFGRPWISIPWQLLWAPKHATSTFNELLNNRIVAVSINENIVTLQVGARCGVGMVEPPMTNST